MRYSSVPTFVFEECKHLSETDVLKTVNFYIVACLLPRTQDNSQRKFSEKRLSGLVRLHSIAPKIPATSYAAGGKCLDFRQNSSWGEREKINKKETWQSCVLSIVALQDLVRISRLSSTYRRRSLSLLVRSPFCDAFGLLLFVEKVSVSFSSVVISSLTSCEWMTEISLQGQMDFWELSSATFQRVVIFDWTQL